MQDQGGQPAHSGLALSSIEAAVDAIAQGGMVVVVDDPDRENEGDLVMAAEFATAESVNFMATYGRGLICVPMSRHRLAALRIPPMTLASTDPHGTAFHAGVDLATSTTGISASERAATIRALAGPDAAPSDFCCPGHVFPLACRAGGVLERPGHTEASVELAILARAQPTTVICEIAAADGEMMLLPELIAFARQHGLPIIAISDLVEHLGRARRPITRAAHARVPLKQGDFTVIGFRDDAAGCDHLAIVLGDVAGHDDVLVRMHSECLTGDVLGSRRCDCGSQLDRALTLIGQEGAGVVVYLRGHEGRGIGLLEKLRAYELQDAGLDTVDANLALGHSADARDYAAGAAILHHLGLRHVRLLTNNPAKVSALETYGVGVTRQIPLQTVPTPENLRYLDTKRRRMGHAMPAPDPRFADTWARAPEPKEHLV
jgi:3,4-dihydroxy 2-butanone 4-phosphate synthase/GTP cyclohydrolase II